MRGFSRNEIEINLVYIWNFRYYWNIIEMCKTLNSLILNQNNKSRREKLKNEVKTSF
jgi:hypothetical protein